MTKATKRPRKATKRPAPTNDAGLPSHLNVNGVRHELAVEIIDDVSCIWHLDRHRHVLALNLPILADNLASEWLGIYRKAAREAAAVERAIDDPDKNDLYGPCLADCNPRQSP